MSKAGKAGWASTISSLAAAPAPRKAARLRTQSKRTSALEDLGLDGREYARLCRIDRLSHALDLTAAADPSDAGDEDEYDEFEESFGGSKKRKAPARKPRKNAPARTDRRLKPTPLSAALSDDLAAIGDRALPPPPAVYFELASAPPSDLPARPRCPVTNAPALYTDPSSKIRYSSLAALGTIRENQPPWVKNLQQGGLEFADALAQVRRGVEERLRGQP
jgi:hypothetical protein